MNQTNTITEAQRIATARMVTILARISDQSTEDDIREMAKRALREWFAATEAGAQQSQSLSLPSITV